MRNIIQYGPGGDMLPACLNEVVSDAVEGQRESLEVHEDTHDDVDPVHGVLARAQNERPEARAQEEDQGHHAV